MALPAIEASHHTLTPSDSQGTLTADLVEVQEVGEGDKAPPEWLGEIEPTFLSYEAVPLLNFPFFNEVVAATGPLGS